MRNTKNLTVSEYLDTYDVSQSELAEEVAMTGGIISRMKSCDDFRLIMDGDTIVSFFRIKHVRAEKARKKIVNKLRADNLVKNGKKKPTKSRRKK